MKTLPVKVGIIDFGMGNLRSVSNAVQAVGAQAEYVKDPESIHLYDRLILPGVGAFGEAIARLQQTGMAQALDEQGKAGKPILGLCLGMQLMCSESEEGGKFKGLGWFKASVKRFSDRLNLKIPHVGWNNLLVVCEHPLFAEIGPDPDVYFVHSYRVECEEQKKVLAWCEYGEPFAAIIGHENILGIQFHPEKSQRVGLAMLHNFAGDGIC
jgi:imidazole glycerol-phosphate synthase subunit HisH